MLVEKKRFHVESFHFDLADVSIPLRIGYETYGTLNEARDNAILICHYFTGTSHAAGKYKDDDIISGWWDALIGPGKAIDTDRFFVICSDVISNINYYNVNVITTGPPSLDPKTGKPYGMTFPLFSIRDMVRLQKLLLESLGIKKLHAVLGPSMGGLQAFQWARMYPHDVGRVLSVVATPMMWPSGIMVPNQLGVEAITLDPDWNNGDYYEGSPPTRGLLLAFKILLVATRHESWLEKNFGRDFADPDCIKYENPYKSINGKFKVEKELEEIVIGRMQFFDANSYLYICKANMLFDLREGEESLQEALAGINLPALMIIDESDYLFTRNQAEEALKHLPAGEAFYYNSGSGHLSCLYETQYIEQALKEFIDRPS